MLKEIAEIKEIELKKAIDNAKVEISNTEKDKLPPLVEELRRLTALDIPRKFNWFQKNITQRTEYQNYIKESEENKIRIPALRENIQFLENVVADRTKVVGDSERKIVMNKNSNSLEELGITSFDQAIELLNNNNKEIILEERDLLQGQLPSRFKDLSSFCFVHKTNALPDITLTSSKSDLDEEIRSEVLIGEAFKTLTTKNGEETVHGTINCIDKNILSKYAILSPFDKIDKSGLVSAAPQNTFFDKTIKTAEGSYILIPEEELENYKNEKQLHSELNLVGYRGNIDKILSVLMNNLAYDEQELTPSGWENTNKMFEFQELVEKTLNEESKINISDIFIKNRKSIVQENRFVPYNHTTYFEENSNKNKKIQFNKAIEYLYKNQDEFNLTKKKLKTRTTVEYDQDILYSNPKDKSADKPLDVFTDFIDILITRDKEKIDEYIKDIDPRLVPNKEEFRDELLKATSRLKNPIPIRDKVFTNLFEKYIDLETEFEDEIETEVESPEIEEELNIKDQIDEEIQEEIILDTEVKEFDFLNKEEIEDSETTEIKVEEKAEIEIDAKEFDHVNEISEEEKKTIISSLEEVSEEDEIIIEPREDERE